MHWRGYLLIAMMGINLSCQNKVHINYPGLISKPHFDTYHGVEIEDPFRNLENLKDSSVVEWFRKNGELTDDVLSDIPNNSYFFDRIKEYERNSHDPISDIKLMDNGDYFYLKRSKEGGTEKLFYKRNNGDEMVLFKPEEFKKDWRINYYKVSWDSQKVAISISPKGEDQSEIRVYDLVSQTLLSDIIKNLAPNVAGTIEWLPDSSGFVYVRFPHFRYDDSTYLQNTEAVLYRLNQEKKAPKVIFSINKNPDLPFQEGDVPRTLIPEVNSQYVYGWIGNVSKNSTTYFSDISDLKNGNLKWKQLFTKEEQIPQFFVNNGYLYFRTSKNTPNFKICRTPMNVLDFNNPEVLVHSIEDEVIVDFVVFEDEVYFSTLKNGVQSKFYELSYDKKLINLELPTPSGSCSLKRIGGDILLGLEGWTRPHTLFKYNRGTKTFENKSLQNDIIEEFEALIVEEIEVESHDGTMVPLSLIYKKDLEMNGVNRTLLLSYGSYGTITSAIFSKLLLVWLEKGDIIAVPHVRGGGEKGDDWYKGGLKITKPNTWKDFIACTEFLIKQGYTSEMFTVAFGNSAGGIPTGRSITERPDLFAASIMTAPALNMLRCEFQPNGQTNIPEFGTVTDSVEFRALLEMDSYHHLKVDEEYPSVLIQIGMNDGLVTPWDPGKFMARLQNLTSTKKPALLDVEFQANHSGGGTIDDVYNNFSRLYSFAMWQTDHPDFQPLN